MNILFCGNLDLSNNVAALTTISFFKNALELNNNIYILASGNKSDSNNINIIDSKSIILYKKPKFKKYIPKTYQIIKHDKKQLEINLPDIIQKKAIDLIIVYSTFLPVLHTVLRISRTNKIKCLTYGGEHFSLNIRNIINTTNIYQFLAKQLIYQKFDGHICSTFYHQNTLKNLNTRSIVIPTIAPYIDLHKQKFNNNSKESFNLIWMGKPNLREHIIEIIKGFKIAQETNNNLKLFLISKMESKYDSLIKKVKKELRNVNNVYITGFLSDEEKNDLLLSANAFIHLRRKSKETAHAFPTRIPEYVAYKKPIIFSDCPPFTNYFRHLHNAYFVNSKNNINEIANAILFLSSNKKICENISINCDKLIQEDFSIKQNGLKLTEFIESFQSQN